MSFFSPITIDEGEMIPEKHGISYRRPQYLDRVCHRMPWNVVVRIGYLAWLWMLCPFRGREPRWWKRRP